jgi:hypothetical protein
MSSTWGSYIRNSNSEAIELAGAELSKFLNCAVHYPAYDKRLFECRCYVTFPVWAVEAAMKNGDWTDIAKHHKGEI